VDCPRCGVPNLPGLVRCVDCDQPMHREPPPPPRWVPPVKPTNPLRVRRPPPERPRRLPRLRLPRIPVAWLGAASVLLGLLAVSLLSRGLRDPVFRFAMAESRLDGGRYRIDDAAMDTLAVGELVLLERPDEVQPTVVVALEGQLLAQGGDALLVDGRPSVAEPVLPWPRQPLPEEWWARPVPPEHVAVWDWRAEGCQRCQSLAIVPLEDLMGRITRRFEDGSYAPVPWPPGGPDEQEEP
jgi:hypothetical protein